MPRATPERTTEIVTRTLSEECPDEMDRMLVAGALVVRRGDHFAIESGGDDPEELDAEAQRLTGLCDCGERLSVVDTRRFCRTCGRQYTAS